MANEILIIGVGSAGVIAADKMDLPNSKKLFVDTDYRQLEAVKSEGDKMLLRCKDFGKCSGNANHRKARNDHRRIISVVGSSH